MTGRIRTRIQARRAARWGGNAGSNGDFQPRQGLFGGSGPLKSMLAQVMDGTKNRSKPLNGPNSGARGVGEERMSRQEWEARELDQERMMSRSEWEQASRNNRREDQRTIDQTERWVNMDQFAQRRNLADVDQNNKNNRDQSGQYLDRDQGPRGGWVDQDSNYRRPINQSQQRWATEDGMSESQYTEDDHNNQGPFREMKEPSMYRDSGRRE